MQGATRALIEMTLCQSHIHTRALFLAKLSPCQSHFQYNDLGLKKP